ncbi:hypothetical protein [Streptomyces sp. NPDC057702]|uniref:hypothetical protein n=1 Tax=unclassified Streptomyces TaxID=2593676 RepID=UPI0036821480
MATGSSVVSVAGEVRAATGTTVVSDAAAERDADLASGSVSDPASGDGVASDAVRDAGSDVVDASVVEAADGSAVGSDDERGASLSSVAVCERPKTLRSRSRMPMDETPHLSSAMRVRHGR